MCGISVMVGPSVDRTSLDAMVQAQSHRGPDACGTYVADEVGLGHNRLSIIDLSDLGRQPMTDESGTLHLVFNGEIYNYQSLRQELGSYPFRSESDSEVLLAAFRRWGVGCLDRLEGMFAFAVWDSRSRSLFAARDRFGVKPLYYHMAQDTLTIASELPAFAAAGIPLVPDEHAWSNYLALGVYDTSEKTFWEHILALPPGHSLCWKAGRLTTNCWYDLAERCQQPDCRELSVVREEYEHLLADSMAKRFRADVPVGINLSGGLDSSVLLGLVDQHFGGDNQVQVFSYVCDDSRYDELPWVERMLAGSDHPLIVSPVAAGGRANTRRRGMEPATRTVRWFANPSLFPLLCRRQASRCDRAVGRARDGRTVGRLRLLPQSLAGEFADPRDQYGARHESAVHATGMPDACVSKAV